MSTKKGGTNKKAPAAPRPTPKPSQAANGAAFPVAGIGASAGGLEAFTKLLQSLPGDTGIAFVLIQHLDPRHESMLTALLSRATTMPVREAANKMQLKPNHVYVIPPKADMTLVGSTLRLTGRLNTGHPHMPVDGFFISLAKSQKHRAIGIVLSGTASDGTAGLREIKAEGGITFAQDQGSARYGAMPRNATNAGVVDFILTPEAIAAELTRISRHPYVISEELARSPEIPPNGKDEMSRIFSLLRAQTGSDFSSYKRATIERRLRRRMALLRTDDIGSYVKILQQSREEVKSLYEDLLINVTEFFRDPKFFEALKMNVFPELIHGRPADSPIRVWVAGCSTGEEVYSIAMLLVDLLAGNNSNQQVQFFGTDISELAIGRARLGVYTDAGASKIPLEYLQRYLTKVEHGYRIGKRIRDTCIFARQDLGKDPPFSRIDLISCRNVLIYLGQDLQNRVLPVFHYALKSSGYLALGNSETVGASQLFDPVDKANKIFMKRVGAQHPDAMDFRDFQSQLSFPPRTARSEPSAEQDLQRVADGLVLAKYGPAGVIINEQSEIVQFRGDVSPYLRPASGPASLNFLMMLREDIAADVNAAVDFAKRGSDPVRRGGLRIDTNEGQPRKVNIEIIPFSPGQDRERLYLILFENVVEEGPHAEPEAATSEAGRLKEEVGTLRKHLQLLMDERQASEEELRSANEEILSSNEELQSTNEELETSQEELQSSNEELTTVNDELHHRNIELSQLGNDLSNLLNSVNIPIVMLGNDLHVRRFTPMAGRVLNLREGDLGRPLMEIRSNLQIPDLPKLLTGVVTDLTPKEIEVQDKAGGWYSLRVRPYRTEENKIDGAVLVLYDIDQLKRSLQEVRKARDFSEVIVEAVPDPLVLLDAELGLIIGNRAFYDTFQMDRRNQEHKPLRDLIRGEWKWTPLIESLHAAVQRNEHFETLEIDGDFERIGRRSFAVAGRRIDFPGDQRKIVLVTFADITAQKELQSAHSKLERTLHHAESSLRESESDLRQNRAELRGLTARLLTTQEEERRRVSRELHDDLNQRLAMLEVDADRLGQQASVPPDVAAKLQSLRSQVAAVSGEIRRVAYQLHPSILDHLGLAVALRSYCSEFSRREGIRVKFSSQDGLEGIPEDIALCFYRVTQEGLRNAARHALPKTVTLKLDSDGESVRLAIKDDGAGFDQNEAQRKGGIGLLSMKERVRLVGGELILKSKPGDGTRIEIRAPLPKDAP